MTNIISQHKRGDRYISSILGYAHTKLSAATLLFHDGGPYYIETSPLIHFANQWTGFHMIGTSVMKELIREKSNFRLNNCGGVNKLEP